MYLSIFDSLFDIDLIIETRKQNCWKAYAFFLPISFNQCLDLYAKSSGPIFLLINKQFNRGTFSSYEIILMHIHVYTSFVKISASSYYSF